MRVATGSISAAGLDAISERIERCMSADRRRLRGRLAGIARSSDGRETADRLGRLIADIERSTRRVEHRRSSRPVPNWPAELPVVERRHEIACAIAEHQVVVLTGDTGSGKTTQLPKICLEIGRGVEGMIGCTQPRRIAARSVARRIAAELGTEVGQAVGCKVRFADQVGPDTFIKLMTDGILLAEIRGDRVLSAYDTIILDEAHERTLNIDFLLGHLHRLLPRRRDLKLVITSATIDPLRFSRHFGGAPVLEVSGRTWPVETRYRPPVATDEDEEDRRHFQGILDGVDELRREAPGDILIFLAGEREIRETAAALRARHPHGIDILPLYANLGDERQQTVFEPHARPRIVLATNVAETSLTVPGIRYVIDSGRARINRYGRQTGVQRLPIEKISRASADQRCGRCGRTAPGICIRLYSEEDCQARPAFTDPEILRTHLAGVILQMKAFGLGGVEEFPFLDPPDYRSIRDGYRTLHELGAIDENNRITETGALLARLPVDPRIGRMILAAREEHVLDEVLVIAAALSVQDPRERPADRAEPADTAHAKFRDPESDFLSYLRLWNWCRDQAANRSQNAFRRLCRENFLSFVRLREWEEVHTQLRTVAREIGLDRETRNRSAVPRRIRH